jgi:hypothetical protein
MNENTLGYNLVNGEWKRTAESKTIIDPMNGKGLISIPWANEEESKEYI